MRNAFTRCVAFLSPSRRAPVHAVVGPSGCGKSTLLYILGLLDHPDRGEVTIESEVVSHLPDDALSQKRNELLGFIFQFHFLMEDFTAQENVMIPMRRLGRLTESEMRERAGGAARRGRSRQQSVRGRAGIFPAANSNAWRSRALWPTIRGSSWPTNRPAISTRTIRRVPLSSCRTLWSRRESASPRHAQSRDRQRLRLDSRDAGRTNCLDPSAGSRCHRLVSGASGLTNSPPATIDRSALLPAIGCRLLRDDFVGEILSAAIFLGLFGGAWRWYQRRQRALPR